MTTVIAYARAQGFAWIDLGVFEENVPAMRLYTALGFVPTGRVEDRFRVEGASITDVQMSLKLR